MSALSGISLRSPPAQLSKEQLKMKAAQLAAATAESYEDDADEGNHLTKEEERERKKMMQAKIRKEQAEGPPPDMSKRAVRLQAHTRQKKIEGLLVQAWTGTALVRGKQPHRATVTHPSGFVRCCLSLSFPSS